MHGLVSPTLRRRGQATGHERGFLQARLRAAVAPSPVASHHPRYDDLDHGARETTFEVNLSGASEDPLLSIVEVELEVAAAERKRLSIVGFRNFGESNSRSPSTRSRHSVVRNRYGAAFELLLECIAATERADEIEPNGRASAYTEWAAMTLRKQKR